MHNLYSEKPDHQGLETQEIEEWTPEEVSDFIDIWAEDRKKAKEPESSAGIKMPGWL